VSGCKYYSGRLSLSLTFILLCLNTLQLAAGMKGKVNRAVARRAKASLATAQFRFDTPQLAQRRGLRRVCCGELH